MYKIREVKYHPSSVSIQVYKIENRKRVIIRHIGTAHNDQEKADLLSLARDFIAKLSKQLSLFRGRQSASILNVDQAEFKGVYYSFFYELICKIIIQIGFDKLKKGLLLDLVVIRMMEPASKLRSIALLDEYFGISNRRQSYYESAPQWLALKSKAESVAINFAKKQYSFQFDLLFYDVTTLYFETFEEDDLRKNGFSKDNKSQQPQILVALMVTKEGFPIAYEIFSGNTFEGHTIVPVVKKFIEKNKIKKFTIVADAAMISDDNIKGLIKDNIHYIVGARLGNLTNNMVEQIDNCLIREDGRNIRLQTDKGDLICSYSSKRYQKDKYEMQKQIEKANLVIKNPSRNKKIKYTLIRGEKIKLNEKLIEKNKKLLGIKGYYTDLKEEEVSNQTVIERYHELYKIEQVFRISKSDLQTRPIFHFKEEPIKLHVLICFIAMVLSKHIELQTLTSIKRFIHECKKITDARIFNKITSKEITMRVPLHGEVTDFLKKLQLLT